MEMPQTGSNSPLQVDFQCNSLFMKESRVYHPTSWMDGWLYQQVMHSCQIGNMGHPGKLRFQNCQFNEIGQFFLSFHPKAKYLN